MVKPGRTLEDNFLVWLVITAEDNEAVVSAQVTVIVEDDVIQDFSLNQAHKIVTDLRLMAENLKLDLRR